MERTKRILEMAAQNYNKEPGDVNINTSNYSITESFQTMPNNNYYFDQEHNAGFIEVDPIILQEVSHNEAPWDNVNDDILIITEDLQVVSGIDPNTEVISLISQRPEKSTNDCEIGWNNERDEWVQPVENASEDGDNDSYSDKHAENIFKYDEPETDERKKKRKLDFDDKEWVPTDEHFTEDEGEDSNTTNKDAESVAAQEESETNKRKRRRKPDPKNWKKNKIATLRRTGKEYNSLTRKGGVKGGELLRSNRKMGPRCTSEYCLKSKKRFCASISDHVREQLFNHFWKQLSWDDRKSYVASLVDCVVPKQKRRVESGDRRCATFHYHLKIDNERKEVCRDMFCNTLSIGVWSVKNWAGSSFHGMRSKKTISENKQGKPLRRVINKSIQTENINTAVQGASHDSLNSKKRKNAVTFIDSLPKLESHYCRKQSSKLYLEPIFQSTMELYRLYQEYCREHDEKSVSRFTFSDILENKNISLFVPRKDQCDICCQHSTGNLSDEDYNKHIEAKDKARVEKEKDKEKAIANECVVYTVDVQAVKLSPCLKASALYYKTKLCCHNYTVFNLANKEVDCYWWHEGEGELKASSFTSCLIHHLQEKIDSWSLDLTRKEIIIWSDGCGYQNKNKIIANALAQLAIKTGFTFEQKFLQKGHTQMEVDSVHATIEKRLKNRNIYLPEDYITVTKEARVGNPYRAHNLNHLFFKNYAITESEIYSSIRPGNKVNDPTINLICHLKYTPDGLIRYKLDFEDELKLLPRRSTSKKEFIYPDLYNSSQKIKQSKWEHLQQLKSVIPHYAHEFYDTLLH